MPGARQTYRSAHFSQRQTIHAAFLLQRKISDKNPVKHQEGGVRKFSVQIFLPIEVQAMVNTSTIQEIRVFADLSFNNTKEVTDV